MLALKGGSNKANRDFKSRNRRRWVLSWASLTLLLESRCRIWSLEEIPCQWTQAVLTC